MNIVTTAKDGATAGNIELRGLPTFVVSVSSATGYVPAINISEWSGFTLNGGYTGLTGSLITNGSGATVVALYKVGSGLSVTPLLAADVGAAATIRVSGTYQMKIQ